MEEAVRALLRRHAFRHGRQDAERIAGDFAVPMIAYHQDRIILFRTRAEIAAAVTTYFAGLAASGVVEVVPDVLEIAPGGPDRGSALVDWRYFRADGGLMGFNRSRLFLRRLTGRGAPQIELVEYLSVGSFSLFATQAAASRRVR
jgi:hypothetical protein